jgi:pyridoxal/pyridoxine/pyridoxamine kinase
MHNCVNEKILAKEKKGRKNVSIIIDPLIGEEGGEA